LRHLDEKVVDRSLSNKENSVSLEKSRPRYLVSEVSLLIALFFFTGLNILYAENKSDFQTSTGSAFYPDLTLLLLILGAAFLTLSSFSFLLVETKRPTQIDARSRVSKTTGAIIADSIFQNKRVITVVAIVYGGIFAFLDGILIYQPSVDFASAYGFSSPAVVVENCCGPPGFIPAGLAYLPAQHFGIQIIPISIVIMILVSLLVGMNVALLITSVKKSREVNQPQKANGPFLANGRSFLGGAFGAVIGVFAGCPTCAAAFFLSMIAGSGATAFSLAISEFQPVIVLVSIPVLLGSILWQSRSIGKMFSGCST
jgi:hypothetical protein